MSSIPILIAGQPAGHPGHFGPGEVEHLLERDVQIWNNQTALIDGAPMTERWLAQVNLSPEMKFILPAQEYTESFGNIISTVDSISDLLDDGLADGLYYFPTTLDEPATNVPSELESQAVKAKEMLSRTGLEKQIRKNAIDGAKQAIREWRIASYAKAREHYRVMKAFLSIKFVVAMPFPVPDISPEDWITPDVGAWPLNILKAGMMLEENLEHWERVQNLNEYWAYITKAEIAECQNAADPLAAFGGLGQKARDVGASAILMSDLSLLPVFFDPATREITREGNVFIEGCRGSIHMRR